MYDPAAMASPPTLLTIVRHGQTSANIDGVWHGSTNTPLTPHGRAQATAAGDFIASRYRPIAHVYASPLDRALDTGHAIAKPLGLTPTVDPELVEFDLGAWEGLPFKMLFEEKKLFQNMKDDPHYKPHGGESPKQAGDRVAGALRRIAERHPGERTVVVSHGGALAIAFGLLIDNDYTSWNRMMKNCAISELVFSPTPELLTFNQVAHLPTDPEQED